MAVARVRPTYVDLTLIINLKDRWLGCPSCISPQKLNTKNLPHELVNLIPKLVKSHIDYNTRMGYPTDIALHNIKTLKIQYETGRNMYGEPDFIGQYTSVNNIMSLAISADEWKQMSPKKRNYAVSVLLHELGHMKISTAKFNEVDNELTIQIGFSKQVIKVQPISTQEEDTFLKWQSRRDTKVAFSGEYILEEIFNDLECGEIDPNFTPSLHPQFGLLLDKISDGKLRIARYTIGIEEYYRSLCAVIPSREKANELLSAMYNTVFGHDCKKAKKRALQLLSEYIQTKERSCLIDEPHTKS